MEFYKTILKTSEEILFKEKKSKFIGQIFPVNVEDEVKPIIENLKKQHPTAGHVCYVYRINPLQPKWRANDDGEPNNSAGMPIYGQLLSFDLFNVLVTVIRYFGGVKLGVGGLISAYKETAQLTIASSDIIEKKIEKIFTLTFDYAQMNKVMRIIKEKQIEMINQKLTDHCELTIIIGIIQSEHVHDWFSGIFPEVIINDSDKI